MSTVTRPSVAANAAEPAIPLNEQERKLIEQINQQKDRAANSSSRFTRRLLSAPLLMY